MVFDFIRYSDDSVKLKEMVENNPEYQHLEEDAFDVIVQYANVPELLEKRNAFIKKDGKVNMSNAIADMIAEGREMGEEMGEDRVSELYLKLMEAERYKDMKKAAKNRKYRKKLLEEFNLK